MDLSETKNEWMVQKDGITTVGLTKAAQQELGEIVYIELPVIGSQIEKEDIVVVLESTKAAADIYSPLSGTIVEVNDTLKLNTECINHDPEGQGWLYRVRA